MLRLSLPTPCHESWDAMTPTAVGRHCAACQKVVIDFTRQTDAELLAYFQRASPGQTCGRFLPAQLERPLAARLTAPQRWQLWLAGLLAAALTTQSCQTPTTGEVRPVAPRHLTHSLAPPPPLMGDTTLAGDVEIPALDSIAISATPPPACSLATTVLGEPAIIGRVAPAKIRHK